MLHYLHQLIALPLTRTCTGEDASPVPLADDGVQVYFPSSEPITERIIRVPSLLTFNRGECAAFIVLSFLVHTTTVWGGLASMMQSMRPIMPRGKYSNGGMLTTTGKSENMHDTRRVNNNQYDLALLVSMVNFKCSSYHLRRGNTSLGSQPLLTPSHDIGTCQSLLKDTNSVHVQCSVHHVK